MYMPEEVPDNSHYVEKLKSVGDVWELRPEWQNVEYRFLFGIFRIGPDGCITACPVELVVASATAARAEFSGIAQYP